MSKHEYREGFGELRGGDAPSPQYAQRIPKIPKRQSVRPSNG